MFIVHLFNIALFVCFGLPLLYLAVLTLAALTVRTNTKHGAARRQRKFAVVVPAHNEASAIHKTIDSIKSVAYDAELFDVVVVADNCTDATARLACESGAVVWERFDAELRGKGYALRWAFDRILGDAQNGYEAVVVIDADSVVSGNYLSRLNVAIEDGADVMQTSDLVVPCPESWTTEALRLSFVLYNFVRPLGRMALGFSAGLRGNGMCFTREALQVVPWHAFSKAEDLEYGLQMLVADYKTRFVPEAVALATMPQQAVNAESQRARWEGGRMPVIRRYAGRLIATAVRTRSLAALDAFIDLATPAFVNMMAVALGMLALSVLGRLFDVEGAGISSGIWLAALAAGVFHVGAGVRAAHDPSLGTTLAAIPRYVVWKALFYLKLARKERSQEWVRTTRETPGSQSPL